MLKAPLYTGWAREFARPPGRAIVRWIICSALLAVAGNRMLAQDYTMTTFAGGGLPDGLAGTSAQLGPVSGVAIDKSGNVYMSVSDPYNVVLRLDSSGTLIRVAGNGTRGFGGDGGPATNAQLDAPFGLAFDSAGNLYIADCGNNEIREVIGTTITTFAGMIGNYGYWDAPMGGGGCPIGIAFDSQGILYVALSFSSVSAISNGVLTTIAGTGALGFSGDNGPATSAELYSPRGLAVDAAGNLYIADEGNHNVRRVSNGTITTIAGNGANGYSGDNGLATYAELSIPSGLVATKSGDIYVADASDLSNVVRLISGGIITTVAGNGINGDSGDSGPATSAQMDQPNALAIDQAGNLFVGEFNGGRLRKVQAGIISTVAGGGSTPSGDPSSPTGIRLNDPLGLAMDGKGNVFIADSGNNRVIKVSNGTATVVAGTGTAGYAGDNGIATNAMLSDPRGIALDNSGNLYVADHDNNVVRMISTSGVITTVAGYPYGGQTFGGDNGPAVNAALNHPNGVAVDPAGNLYIADTLNERVRKVANGVITTIAGTGAETYNGDNLPAVSANLGGPVGIAFDSAGNLYIAEEDNNRIRMVSNGIITTVAGTGTSGFAGDGGPATQASLCAPWGVTVDNSGSIYLGDECNCRVRKISSGIITTIAGDGGVGFNGDGGHPATNLELIAPSAVVADSNGDVYVADSGNNRVRVLTPATQGCTYSVTPTSVQADYNGGVYTVNVQTGPSCAWDSLGSLCTDLTDEPWTLGGYCGSLSLPLTYGGGVGSGSIRLIFGPFVQPAIQSGIGSSGQILVAGVPVTVSLVDVESGAVLSVEQAHAGSFTQGQTDASYSVVVTNAASAAPTIGPVTVTESIPAGLVMESMSGNGWVCWANTNTCTRDDVLVSGGSYPPVTIVVDVAVNAPAQVTAQATASGGGTSSVTATDLTAIQPSSGPTISAGGLTGAASYGSVLVAGSITADFGNFLLGSPTASGALPLPFSLSGLSMQFGNNLAAPLFYVSGAQINAQVPWEVAGQAQAAVTVTVNGQTSPAGTASVAPVAPGIFTINGQGTGQGAILDPAYHLVDSSNPAVAGSTAIQIFCTGLGAVTNQPATGAPAPTSPLARTIVTPQVFVGDASGQVLFSGLAPGFVGLYQVNALVPAASPIGPAVPVVILIGGVVSNSVTIAVSASGP
jgi:uncharacterized protein (TIGR03437 family)